MFDYLTEKVRSAHFTSEPFQHIYIENFLSEEHFRSIITADEIKLPPADTDQELFASLFESGYKIVPFPGTDTNLDAYIKWRAGTRKSRCHPTTDATGIVLRLLDCKNPLLDKLSRFFASSDFNEALAEKFGLDSNTLAFDSGLQKYLDGYEICPHPDARKKAATYMLNINPASDSDH